MITNDLKPSWPLVKFGDVVRQVKDRVDRNETGLEYYLGGEHFSNAQIHVNGRGTIAENPIGPAFHMRFKPGQVLVVSRNPHLRKAAIAEFEGICANTTYVCEANGEFLLPEFLPFLMQTDSFWTHAEANKRGSTNPYLNWGDFARFEFQLPPKDEQSRIASIYWTADECLQALSDTLAATREVRHRSLLALYRDGIGHSNFIDTPIGPRPSDWRVAELQEIYEVRLGKMISPKSRDGEFQRPYIRNANVQWNRLDLEDVATMSFSPSEVPRFELHHGDILACEGRHVGKSAIWRNEIPGACYQKALHRLRPRSLGQVPEFMLYQMEFASITGVFAETTGETTIPHLPAERLRTILFSFPPEKEQREIANRILSIDEAIAIAESHLTQTKSVTRQYLDQEFLWRG